jgi:hypothetical protein
MALPKPGKLCQGRSDILQETCLVWLARKENPMKKNTGKSNDELRPEYNLKELLKGGVRGKYVERYRAGTNLVPLDPDVVKAFPDEAAINEALRLVIRLADTQRGKKRQRAKA